MRTWSNALPSTAHPGAASGNLPSMTKSAFRFRLIAAEPYALAKGRAAASGKCRSPDGARLSLEGGGGQGQWFHAKPRRREESLVSRAKSGAAEMLDDGSAVRPQTGGRRGKGET